MKKISPSPPRNVKWFGRTPKRKCPYPKPLKSQEELTRELFNDKDYIKRMREQAIEEEAEKKRKREEEKELARERHYAALGQAICSLSLDDFILPQNQSSSIPDDVKSRGEEIVGAVITFAINMKALLGETTTRNCVFADSLKLAGVLTNVSTTCISSRAWKKQWIMKEKKEKIREDLEWKKEFNTRLEEFNRMEK